MVDTDLEVERLMSVRDSCDNTFFEQSKCQWCNRVNLAIQPPRGVSWFSGEIERQDNTCKVPSWGDTVTIAYDSRPIVAENRTSLLRIWGVIRV